ncbi:GNAT family N-acetyltransferase [Streptomyces sp. NPDC093589]|uniref:GNAT family N-acetyltransferase n=1 Tax=Streptomyces sp. NPDC093589 TaxID=3366043 RepID=UPI00380A55F8
MTDGAVAGPVTARLDLLPLREADAPEMARVLADPALYLHTGGAPQPEDALRARYRRLVAGSPDPAVRWCNWLLRLRAEDRLTGYVQATIAAGQAELAWVVGTPWQGRGPASEAVTALAAALPDAPYGVTVLLAHIHPGHHASAAVATAAGLRPTAARRDGEVRWERRLAPRGGR